MANARQVGAYLYTSYKKQFYDNISEMMMYKLMYFSQRESLILYCKCLFDETFYGWKFGPVLKSVKVEYDKDQPYQGVEENLHEQEKVLLDSILKRYTKLSLWKLNSLSRAEYSWRRSRKNNNAEIELNAIKVDAAREKARRKRKAQNKNS